MRNEATFEVELKIKHNDEEIKRLIPTPPGIRSLHKAEEFALEIAERDYPNAEIAIVAVTDYLVLREFFPARR